MTTTTLPTTKKKPLYRVNSYRCLRAVQVVFVVFFKICFKGLDFRVMGLISGSDLDGQWLDFFLQFFRYIIIKRRNNCTR